jgi:hypothetical protein
LAEGRGSSAALSARMGQDFREKARLQAKSASFRSQL